MKSSWLILALIVVLAVAGGAWYLFFPSRLAPPAKPGTIQGSTSYPSEFNPAQQVCAQLVGSSRTPTCASVPEQNGMVVPTFSLTVPAGTYHVYAQLTNPADMGLESSGKAYWSAFVKCGLAATCKDHTPLDVVVGDGQTVSGINPQDWYTNN